MRFKPLAAPYGIQSNRYAYLIAETEGESAGFIAMRDRTHVFHLFVTPGHQRRGLARALWLRAREAAGSLGPEQEFTVNSSPSAECVYKRFGFERVSGPVQQDGVEFIPMRNAGDRDAA